MAARVVERRIVTVLFADLVGFTSLSERLDAEDVVLVQDAYFDAVRETVARHSGELEKFVGDAVLAVFGVPRARDDDAERAVRAGLALVAAVGRVGASFGLDEDELRVRVGINSGEVVYGEASADRGPVTGDTVNVAARLQSAAAPGSVLVGELTALAVADSVVLARVEPLELKGKSEPVAAARVVDLYPERSRERALAGLRAPTIGRDAELERLRGGFGRLVVVAPPGVGKTRLLEEHARAAEHDGSVILRARLRPDLLSPFEPVGQLVRSVGTPDAVLRRLPRDRGEVVRDALAAVVAPVEAGTAQPDNRDVLFAAWLEGLDALAGDKPPIWHVEDLHWASPDLLAFLDVAGRDRYVVGTARPSLLEQAADWCVRAEVLHLAPLPQPTTADLVRALVGDALPDALVARIAASSGGNALFVEELLRSWISAGTLLRKDDGWTLGPRAQDVSLPATVQAIYTGQLDDLPLSARVAAQRAAVAGRRFAFGALQPLAVPEPRDAVAVLLRRALVAETADDPVLGETYVYRHALLRDAGYATLARGERATLHVAVADWLSRLAASARATLAEVIARHYAAALDQAPELARTVGGKSRDEIRNAAAEWFELASDVAAGFAAWESARSLGLRALELGDAGDAAVRARRLERLGIPTAYSVGVEEAKAVLRDALEQYRAARPGNEALARGGLARTGAMLADLLHAQTWFIEAEALTNQLLEELGPPEDVDRARLYAARAVAVVGGYDDFERAEVDAERALALARAAGDRTVELAGVELLARIASERGDEDAADRWSDVERLARELGDWPHVAAALRIRAAIVADRNPELALQLVAGAQEFADAHGLIEAHAWCDYLRAELRAEHGGWDEAVDAGLRAIELAEAHEFERVGVRSWFVLLPLSRVRGDRELALRAVPLFERLTERPLESPYQRIIVSASHLHFAAFGLMEPFVPDLEPRLSSFDLDHSGASWIAAVDTVVETWIAAGLLDGVGAALDRMRASIELHPTPLADGAERILRGRLALARGDREVASEHASRALEVLGPTRLWWRARALRLLGELDEAAEIEARLAAG